MSEASFDLRAHTHLLTLAGSRVYGLQTPTSDVDLKGVAIPPAAYFYGFTHIFEQAATPAEMAVFAQDLPEAEQQIARETILEGTVYDLRKFLALATETNPNILDVLFCRDQDVRRCTPLGERLRDARGLFLSARARQTYAGYARAQLKRIETHRRWLLDPPQAEPTRGDFGLPERTLIPSDQLKAAEAAVRAQVDRWELDLSSLDDATRIYVLEQITTSLTEIRVYAEDRWRAAGRYIGLDENFIELLDRERRYKGARNNWEQYHHWVRTRNPARSALEAVCGYDAKHGAHLLRLLRMGREILERGVVRVWRGDHDAEELRAIRAGTWPYERLMEAANAEDAAMSTLMAEGRIAVPPQPDRAAIEALCISLVEAGLAA